MSNTRNPVHWFEISVSDLGRATAFYEAVLGIKFQAVDGGSLKMAWFPRQTGSEGSTGALVAGPDRSPSKAGALIYLTVDDIEAAISTVIAKGGKIVTPKASGDYGSIAHFDDCEGNRVALYSKK